MRYAVLTVILICAGVFLWPLILTSGRRLSSQFSEVWSDKQVPPTKDNSNSSQE